MTDVLVLVEQNHRLKERVGELERQLAAERSRTAAAERRAERAEASAARAWNLATWGGARPRPMREP
jgi:cell division septum initiation protein DivIVA